MSPDKAWITGPHIGIHRSRQSLSETEHRLIAALLSPDQLAAQRIVVMRDAMFAGHHVNSSENRAVGHWALRQAGHALLGSALPQKFSPNGEDLLPRMHQEHKKTSSLVQAIKSGQCCASNGQPFKHIVHLGIGGSDLGPQLLIDALRKSGQDQAVSAHFLSNVDYHAVDRLLRILDPAVTLVVIVSKSFSTQETMLNAAHLRQWMRAAHLPSIEQHFIGITHRLDIASNWGIPKDRLLWFDESVGGRFSLWGPVSLTARVVLGNPVVDQFLQGGIEMDQHFLVTPLASNLPAVLAASDFYNLRHRQLPTLMVSAYDSRLALLVPYLKQLWMESLGKQVDVHGRPLNGPACPILWGDVGTNSQHAFFQLLHQGLQGVAIDLIGVLAPDHNAKESHRALTANLLAQAQALSIGRETVDNAKNCLGGHPVNLLMLDALSPSSLGALITLWEHRVLCLAAFSHINPFDQWGVELGKTIAKSAEKSLQEPWDPQGLDTEDKNDAGLDSISRDLIAWLRSNPSL